MGGGAPIVPPARSSYQFMDFTNSLPVTRLREDIIAAINNNRVTMITGETGSGKTTQVGLWLHKLLTDTVATGQSFHIFALQNKRLLLYASGGPISKQCRKNVLMLILVFLAIL